MKKLILMLMMSFILMSLSAEPIWFKATAMKLRQPPQGEWSNWIPTAIPVYFDAEAKHIEILSQDKQIIDFNPMIQKRVSNANIYGSYGTDTDYGTIFLVLYFFDSGELQLHISYDNLEYIYQLVEYE